MYKIILLLALLPGLLVAMPTDSVGTETKNGKKFLLYRVEHGQTLYGLIRRYGTTAAVLREANPEMGEALKFDQLLRIPVLEKTTSATPTSVVPETHTVEQGQTVYGIAKKYGILVAELIRINNLSDDGAMKIGQVLALKEKTEDYAPRVVMKEETPEKKAETPPVVIAVPVKAELPVDIPKPTKEEAHIPEKKPEPPIAPKAVPKKNKPTEKPQPAKKENPEPEAVRPPANGKKVVEIGLCELIDADNSSGKYLALHRTAAVGSMLTIRNEANNQQVMVKVIGKLPDLGSTDKVIVRLSARAFEKLQPTDNRIRAEVSYYAVP